MTDPAAKRARTDGLPLDWETPALAPEEHAIIEKAAGRHLSTSEAREFLYNAQNLAAIGLRLAERKDLT
jgi:hypothetical protein